MPLNPFISDFVPIVNKYKLKHTYLLLFQISEGTNWRWLQRNWTLLIVFICTTQPSKDSSNCLGHTHHIQLLSLQVVSLLINSTIHIVYLKNSDSYWEIFHSWNASKWIFFVALNILIYVPITEQYNFWLFWPPRTSRATCKMRNYLTCFLFQVAQEQFTTVLMWETLWCLWSSLPKNSPSLPQYVSSAIMRVQYFHSPMESISHGDTLRSSLVEDRMCWGSTTHPFWERCQEHHLELGWRPSLSD